MSQNFKAIIVELENKYFNITAYTYNQPTDNDIEYIRMVYTELSARIGDDFYDDFSIGKECLQCSYTEEELDKLSSKTLFRRKE
ncbi:MAG: hypothetical protein IJ566_02360 [Cardiobacteriaceae bacterium]|nr:hypothetical protein [Cardiobacteriaceae bacterium]